MLDPSIGLAIFAYNRPSHLRRVLIALEDYKIKNINVFIDGPKNIKDKVCQEEIVFMLKTNKNLKSKIMINKKNKGLAYSLINGITKMSKKYNRYFWNKNAGYGTKNHLSAIKKFGVTKHHRKTFQPMHNILSLK